MQTSIHESFRELAEAAEAEAILSSCVHCGFCNATCPTYQQLHDERDGPRGRIYLIKQFLESGEATENTRVHLDRCLTCRSCETTCPSGVQYARLADIGRGILERKLPRPVTARGIRWLLRNVVAFRRRFALAFTAARVMKPLLPSFLRRKIPSRMPPGVWPAVRHDRVMFTPKGCVQSSVSPNTNAAAARVLDKLGVSLIDESASGCCGAVSYHLGHHDEGKAFFRKNIDAWWPLVESGAEALVLTASGCGSMVKEYGEILKSDPEYAEKAAVISGLARDLSEVVLAEDIERLNVAPDSEKVAVHCPCTLQHAQKLPDGVDHILARMGFNLARTRDKHLCCGSAGTYSILQPQLSRKLLAQKVEALSIDAPDKIVTANVGCQLDLGAAARVPVRHWVEIVDDALVDR